MKKTNIILIFILALLIGFGGGYFVFKYVLKDEVPVDNEITDQTEETSTTETQNISSDKEFIVKYDYDYIINGKKHIISFNFFEDTPFKPHVGIYLNLALDGVKVFNSEFFVDDFDKDDNPTKTYFKQSGPVIEINPPSDSLLATEISTNDMIQIIKGQDKEYILFTYTVGAYGQKYSKFIINDKGNIISELPQNASAIQITDESRRQLYNNKYGYRIGDTALYYLDVDCNNLNGKIIEYEVTINNDKINKVEAGRYEGYGEGALYCGTAVEVSQ